MRRCKRAVTYRSGPLRPGRSGGRAPAQEGAKWMFISPTGSRKTRIRQRTCIDGLEPALGHDLGHGCHGRPVVGRHERLDRGAALAGLGGQLREDRVERLHHLGLGRELLDLLRRRGGVPDQQILEVFRDRVRDVDQDLAGQVAGRPDRLFDLLVRDRQDHDVGEPRCLGDAAALRAPADLPGELRGFGRGAPADETERPCGQADGRGQSPCSRSRSRRRSWLPPFDPGPPSS